VLSPTYPQDQKRKNRPKISSEPANLLNKYILFYRSNKSWLLCNVWNSWQWIKPHLESFY